MAENILTYVLNLQDNISDKLKRIGINNEQQLDTWARMRCELHNKRALTLNDKARCMDTIIALVQ